MMRIRGMGRLKKAYRTLQRQFRPGAVILMYHRVANLATDHHALAVTPEHFAAHLSYLSATCQPMRLLDLIDALQQHALPKRAVAITFDDGYVDNYQQAYPLLKKARLPATIFVTAGMLDGVREFWWDDLERLLLLPAQLPNELQISINGQTYAWPTGSMTDRRKMHEAVYWLVRPLPHNAREKVLNDLADWASMTQTGRPDYRAVTTSELMTLAQSDLIEIGGHTLHHPQLSSLSPDMQTSEIVGGCQRLEMILERTVQSFAYPYGDFSETTAAIVCAAGFRTACTTRHGSIESGNDLFQLRRCAVSDWDITTFKQKLDSFFVARD
jgi:peptidoglycan/xylan/chitin deacetylase (PgdA/CDA1 family)